MKIFLVKCKCGPYLFDTMPGQTPAAGHAPVIKVRGVKTLEEAVAHVTNHIKHYEPGEDPVSATDVAAASNEPWEESAVGDSPLVAVVKAEAASKKSVIVKPLQN